ncbi:MAG: hypothetical protein QOC86_371, partial [Gaiellales bacterium]|nr:hypothetical protein [Gaiellales bacterium]
ERVNPTMLSRIAARLAELQLIRREADADDRRATRVEATKAGKALHERIRAQRQANLAAHLDDLPEGDLGALIAALPALEALAEGLRRDAPGPSTGLRA